MACQGQMPKAAEPAGAADWRGSKMSGQSIKLMLNNGNQVECLWLDRQSMAPLRELAGRVDSKMLGRHRQDLTDQAAMAQWLEGLGQGGLTVLAAMDPEADGRTAGYAYLQKGAKSSAHIGEVEAFIHPDYREMGLGSALLRLIADFAESQGLMFLKVDLPAERRDLVTAYKRLGFQLKAILEDYRVDRSGHPYDVIIMVKRLAIRGNRELLYSY